MPTYLVNRYGDKKHIVESKIESKDASTMLHGAEIDNAHTDALLSGWAQLSRAETAIS